MIIYFSGETAAGRPERVLGGTANVMLAFNSYPPEEREAVHQIYEDVQIPNEEREVMAKVRRLRLLQALEAVMPGLSKKDKFEQSTCYVFVNGRVVTYNDDISCRAKTGLPREMEGAVDSQPLLTIIRKFKEDEIDVEMKDSEIIISGKSRRKSGIRLDPEIALPIEKVERPEKGDWRELHEKFGEAIATVQSCAGTNQAEFAWTCLHFHKKWIEACDNNQVTRYRLKTGIKNPIIIPRTSIKHIVPLDMTEFAETDVWIHFRNPAGIELACKRFVEKYPDVGPYLNATGTKTILPKGIADDSDFAETFSQEVESNLVVVTIKSNGRMLIKGVGVSGWASAPKKIKYRGPDIAFCISPSLLAEITKKHTECRISAEHIRVDGGRWTYVGCLGDPAEEEKKAEAAAEAAALDMDDPGDEEDTEERDSQWEDE